MTDHVVSSSAGPVYRIELNRPDCGNLVTTEMVFALTDAVSRLPADAKLLVLSGKGADFCKGRDPQTAPEAARGGRAPSALTGACDIALAGKGSRFRLPEMGKGLPPTLAMAALDKLTAKGLGYLVYSTTEVDARAALAMGLVSAVVPDGALNAEAGKLIDTISSQPLDAVKAVKEYLKFAPLMEPRGRADFAASVIAGVLSSR